MLRRARSFSNILCPRHQGLQKAQNLPSKREDCSSNILRTTSYSPPEKWKPKQCVAVTPEVFLEVAGTASQQIARYIVDELLSLLPKKAVIHDNACGTEVVSKELMRAASTDADGTQDMTIHATDQSEAMVAECQALAVKQGLTAPTKRLTSQVMAMQDLKFPDKTFTHSITNFAIFALDPANAAKAAAHVYRTLQDKGIAVFTVWEEAATASALQEAHQETRSTMISLPLLSTAYWKYPSHIKKVLTRAGFTNDKIEITKRSVGIGIKDLDRWSNVAWTLIGRPAGGWQEGDEEQWDVATALVRDHCRKSENFRVSEDGECSVRNWVNVVVARK